MERTAEQFANAGNVLGFTGKGRGEQLPTAVGPMAEVWHNSLRFLTDADAKAMATYLEVAARGDLAAQPGPDDGAALSASGRRPAVPRELRRLPHAERRRRGRSGPGPELANNPVVLAPSPDDLLSMVLGGQVAQHDMVAMPTFKHQFTDAEIAAVLSYVRTSWGNGASQVTPEQVAAFRQKFFPGKGP